MRRRMLRRNHFAPLSSDRAAAVIDNRDYIPRVYGAAPAIVFEPLPPIASITRTLRKRNLGWEKLQAIQNGARDHIHGYDDGEAEPQSRGIH